MKVAGLEVGNPISLPLTSRETVAGRYLVIIYQMKVGGVVRAFTGWPMSVPDKEEL